MRFPFGRMMLVSVACVLSLGSTAAAFELPDDVSGDLASRWHQKYVPGELLVKFKPGVSDSTKRSLHSITRAVKKRELGSLGIEHFQLPADMSVETAVAVYSDDPNVEYAEPNYLRHAMALPNDTDFGLLWGLQNTGQTVNGTTGTADADIDAQEAWDITTGSSSVIIAVVDSGVAWEHPDLAANIWTNPGETAGNGIDDDGNGFVDDVHGWDFVDNDNDPTANDDPGHGTHVAGTIAAVGNNATGVTGVMWTAQIMPVRFLDALGSGSVSDEILAINYAIDNGAKIINASYGSSQSSLSEQTAISAANAAGLLFVAAAGNAAANTDNTPSYPASYDLPNIISVAASDQNDDLAFFSNYGVTTVDLVAPGTNTYSTIVGREHIFVDDFESGLGNWTTGGTNNTWGLTTAASVSPTHSVTDSPSGNYANNTDSYIRLTAGQVLTGVKKGCRLDFQRRLTLQLVNDTLFVAQSPDGNTWTEFAAFVGNTGGAFRLTDFLDLTAGQPSVFVRFRFSTNASLTSDGVYIDDVDINCAATSSGYTGTTEYQFLQGTSMATPHVTGVAGLVASLNPSFSPVDIKKAILNSVDQKSAFTGKVVSGGRLNAYGAVQYASGADLGVVETASANAVTVGHDLTYTVTVTNNGLLNAVNVALADTIPAGASFVSASPACSGTNTVTCNWGNLANGANVTVTIMVNATSTGTLTNTVSVAGATTDSFMTNNSSTVSVTVRSPSSGGGCGGNIASNGPSLPSGSSGAAIFLAALFFPLVVTVARRWVRKSHVAVAPSELAACRSSLRTESEMW
jgi:uncharacterized repeat protein (TIGR01451 family)